MHPIIFSFHGLTLRSFGLMMALAFLTALFGITRLGRRGVCGGKLTEDAVAKLMLSLMIGGILGARLAYVAEHWSAEFAAQGFFQIFRIDQGGLMFYGGLAGAIVGIAGFCAVNKINLIDTLDVCAVMMPLCHALGRVGCFLNGCCYGLPHVGCLGVIYPRGSFAWYELGETPVWPVQLIEAAAEIILFAVLWIISRSSPRRGLSSGIYLVGYAVIRFCTEFMRGDPRMALGGFSISQTISIAALAAGIAFFLCPSRNKD